MITPGRSFSAGSEYRYGFNGKEKDEEIASDNYDFGSRIYDGRIGRWLSLDPFQKKYPAFSPYDFVENNPLVYKDVDGKDKWYVITINDERTGKSQTISIKVSNELMYEVVGQWSDGNGHGSRGEKLYYDINLNYNINIDKNGKRTTTVSENRGVFRIAVDNSPGNDESWPRTKMWWKDKLFPDPVKQADIGQGFFFTSENVKGQGDPYEPGAQQIDVINNADAFFTMLGKAGSVAEGAPVVSEEIKDMPQKFIDRLVEALLKGMDVQQNGSTLSDMADERAAKKDQQKQKTVTITRTSSSSEYTNVKTSGSNAPDTIIQVKRANKTNKKR